MATLWETLLFWKKKSPKMLKEGVDFHYVDLDLVGAEGQSECSGYLETSSSRLFNLGGVTEQCDAEGPIDP